MSISVTFTGPGNPLAAAPAAQEPAMTDTIVTDATAQQKLDRIRGLVENGYGPEHLAAAVLIAVDPSLHDATLASLDE